MSSGIEIEDHVASRSRIPPDAYASYILTILHNCLKSTDWDGTEWIIELLDDFDKRLKDHGIAVEGGPHD